jgi:hypothetical protein
MGKNDEIDPLREDFHSLFGRSDGVACVSQEAVHRAPD